METRIEKINYKYIYILNNLYFLTINLIFNNIVQYYPLFSKKNSINLPLQNIVKIS